MSSNVELARAYVQVMPSFDGATDSITSGLVEAVGGSASSKAGLAAGEGLSGGILSSMGKFLAPAAVAGAVAGVGKALFDLGSEFDSAYDSIKAGTGATGDALQGLEDSFRSVSASVPNDMQSVADTLAEVNTRTGATGEVLEGLTQQFLNLGNLGYDMDVDAATGMLTAWGVSAEDMSGKLDELFVVSQSTGVGMDSLSSAMSGNAQSMQQLGFSFEDTASMAGLLDKAGLDASSMMGKMSKACVSLAKDGEQPAEAYKRVIEQMNGFISAGDEASAMNLASDLFGTKGAAQFIQALETGALDIDAMSASLADASGAISENEANTRSAAESFDMLKNNAMLLLEPLGSAVFGTVSDILAGAIPVVQDLGARFKEWFDGIMANEQVQGMIGKIGEIVQKVGEVAQKWFGVFLDSVTPLLPALAPLVDFLGGAFMSALDGVSWVLDRASDAMGFFKSLFSGTLEFPHISIPHLYIDGGQVPWGIGGMGYPPTIDIDWYAKGGVATSAAVVGVGEAGSEAILPLNSTTYREIARGIASSGAGGVTVNIERFVNNDSAVDVDALIDEIGWRLKRKGVQAWA